MLVTLLEGGSLGLQVEDLLVELSAGRDGGGGVVSLVEHPRVVEVLRSPVVLGGKPVAFVLRR